SQLIPALSRVFLTPPLAAQLRPAVDPEMDRSTQVLPSETSVLSIDNPGIVLSAIKQRESGDGLIVRVVNPQAYPAEGVLSWNPEVAGRIGRIVRCNLAEVEEAAYPFDDGNVRLNLRGGEILTLAVVF
ncbi:MAG: hypothetical protein KAU31_10980, partial [Spirochaetaceae bacterium]|nr:hypothetical protein [Spirochaetaceae bacterium]